MQQKHQFSIKMAIGLIAFSAQAAMADATLHFKRGTGSAQETHNMIFIKDHKINLSQADVSPSTANAPNYSIFDATQEKIIHVNPQRKAYMEMDKTIISKQVAKMKKSIEMMQQQMEERLKTMPPDQQKMMRKMMQVQGLGPEAMPPAKPKKQHVKTGKYETIAGIRCERVEVLIENVRAEELCVAKETLMGLKDADAKAVIAMKKFMNYMSKSARNVMPNQPVEEAFDGLPIRTRSYDQEGKLVGEIVLDSISLAPVSPDKVTVPAGYQLVDTPQMH